MSAYVKRISAGIGAVAMCSALVTVFGGKGDGIAEATAAGCADYNVAFARGIGETPGVGEVGQAFVDSLTQKLPGKSVSSYGVDYPADWDFGQAEVGTNDLSRHIQHVAAECPSTKFIVGGYSQGAAVVDILLSNDRPNDTYTNPLPPALDSRIAAVALFGNPTQVQLPGLNADLTIKKDQMNKVIALCNDGDFVCDPNGGGLPAHTTYATDGSVDKASGAVARFVGGGTNGGAQRGNGTQSVGTPISTISTDGLTATPTSAAPKANTRTPATTSINPVASGTLETVPSATPGAGAPAATGTLENVPAPDNNGPENAPANPGAQDVNGPASPASPAPQAPGPTPAASGAPKAPAAPSTTVAGFGAPTRHGGSAQQGPAQQPDATQPAS